MTLLEARLERLRDSLEALSIKVDDNLRSILLRLTCDNAVSRSAPLVNIDSFARATRERCLILLARQHPVASDLKFSMAALRVGQDYERIQELAMAMDKRIDRLIGTPVQDLVQDMTGVMADILKLHEKVCEAGLPNRKSTGEAELKPKIDAIHSAIHTRITSIQSKILEAIARGGENAEIYVEIVLACQHLKRIAQTLETIPQELHAFDNLEESRVI